MSCFLKVECQPSNLCLWPGKKAGRRRSACHPSTHTKKVCCQAFLKCLQWKQGQGIAEVLFPQWPWFFSKLGDKENHDRNDYWVLEATCFDLRLTPPAPEAHVFAVAEAWRSKSGGLFLTATSSPNRCKHIDAVEAPGIWKTALKKRRATKSGRRRFAPCRFILLPPALSQLQVLIS